MQEKGRIVRYIAGEFFTGAYRITGKLGVGAAGLTALLNDATHSLAVIEDAYVSHISQPGTIVAHYAESRVVKTALELMVLTRRDDRGPVPGRTGLLRIAQHKVMLATSAFEVRGVVEVTGLLDPEVVLFDRVNRFVPVFSATAHATNLPSVTYSGEVALINRANINLFCEVG